jgi:selenocysteine lyase/cysteine desulfurase
MHKYNGIVFFDYASAAPHVKIDMNPVVENIENITWVYKDAIIISCHKLVPQTPGRKKYT